MNEIQNILSELARESLSGVVSESDTYDSYNERFNDKSIVKNGNFIGKIYVIINNKKNVEISIVTKTESISLSPELFKIALSRFELDGIHIE